MMHTHTAKTPVPSKSVTPSPSVSPKNDVNPALVQFADNRPEATTQRKLQEMVSNSSQAVQLRDHQEMANTKYPPNGISTFNASPVFSLKNNRSSQVIQRVKNIKPGEAVTVHDDEETWHGTVESEHDEFYMITRDGATEAEKVAEKDVTRRALEAPTVVKKIERKTISEEESKKKRAMMRSRRLRGGNQSVFIKSGISSQAELQETMKAEMTRASADKRQFEKGMVVLTKVLKEPWAQEKFKEIQREKPRFVIKYSAIAGRGETDSREIRFGPEALENEEVFRICLRHEFDHALLQFKELPVGDFIAEYVPKKGRSEKGTFVYQLEEVIVRIRDYEHQIDKSKKEFVRQDEAIPRIHKAYAILITSDQKGLPEGYADDILHKLDQIGEKLDIKLR